MVKYRLKTLETAFAISHLCPSQLSPLGSLRQGGLRSFGMDVKQGTKNEQKSIHFKNENRKKKQKTKNKETQLTRRKSTHCTHFPNSGLLARFL